ncbi:MAG: hypothetical protein ABF904_12735 [Ethanoligenens sp.]
MTAKIIFACVAMVWAGMAVWRCIKKQHSIVTEVAADFMCALFAVLFILCK